MSFVQPIIVPNRGTHENTIKAVVFAAYAAFMGRFANPHYPIENWDKWLAGSFTKSIRRADEKLWKKIHLLSGKTIVSLDGGTGQAIAFPPMKEFPKEIKKCQVADTDFERTGWIHPPANGFVLAINPNVQMTTGKTAAQCAHAYLGFHLSYPDIRCSLRITDDPIAFQVLKNSRKEKVEINDAGFTEVDPGTLTVIAGIL